MLKVIVLVIAVFLLIPIASVCGNGTEEGHMGGWDHMMNFSGGGVIMWVLLIILLGVIIYLFFLKGTGGGRSGNPQETPLEIIKKRYARGEITEAEFKKMKRDLESE
ncbi:MAG TPA: SHOCT domain-containing protein [bacterium]|nr:SHOCT domain-containing protein [bacterium]HPQ65729.1 SHOCT domain-containing protein [bacterium]